ncbi:uncharacterized protein V6R79_018660 [Siganus canaliculatus]
MASMERKHETCSTFLPRRNSLRKSSAEIVSEARQFLRVRSTQRPFTPKDGPRHLFENSSIRAGCNNRPPSSFSLHAQNFEAPDSRPGSGTRLSPLDHKPKFPVTCNNVVELPFKAFPKPPTDPTEGRRGSAEARTRLLRTGSLTMLPCVDGNADVGCGLKPVRAKRQASANRLSSSDHVEIHTGPYKPGCPRTTSESGVMSPGDDSGAQPTESRAEQRTDLRNEDSATGTGEDAELLVWNNTFAPLLRELESAATGCVSEGSVDRLCDVCDDLYAALAEADMLGRRCKKRSGILRALFRLVDLHSARLNLHIAKLCLALNVSGNNLLNICKLVFQISRSESNDTLFENNSIIDSVLAVLSHDDVFASGEAVLYCVGTLKFLSGNSVILRLLLDKDCMGVAQKLIQKLCMAKDANLTMAEHILVELTATLRNLADHPDSRPLFVSLSMLSELCVVLRHHRRDADICTNISRIYSKLSSYSECRLALAQTPDCYPLFLELLSKHHQKQDLVVRLLFTLGNLTAKSEEARLQLFQCERCTDTLLHSYDGYQRRDPSLEGPPLSSKPSAPAACAQEADDVLVKLLRLLANMCIHPDVGPALAANATCVRLLMETLELRSVQENEDLLVNVAATINNLSYYQEENSEIRHNRLGIAKLMLKLMLSNSMDAMLEATRVYGNLTLFKDVRDFIMQNKVHRFLVTLLDSKSAEMCFSACGVLTNLALDPSNGVSLSQEGAAAKLVDCLVDLAAGDWQLAGQVCQALWNMICSDGVKLLGTQEREALLEVLITYSGDYEALKGIESEDMRDYHKACWEFEFQPVAQKLTKTLQNMEQVT